MMDFFVRNLSISLVFAVLWKTVRTKYTNNVVEQQIPFVFPQNRISFYNHSIPTIKNGRYLDYYKAYGLRYQKPNSGKFKFPNSSYDARDPITEMSANEVTLNESASFSPQTWNKFEGSSNKQHGIKTSRVERALEFIAGRLKKLLQVSLNLKNGDIFEAPTFGRFLNIFSVIKFDNAQCSTKSKPLRQLNGICYRKDECAQLGGSPIDTCANGFGVCCAFQVGCASVTSQGVTYFESPGFPSAYRQQQECSITVLLQEGVKQLLLEFLFFEMLPPENGTCTKDQFKILIPGLATSRYPTLCGINTGQHMYLNVEGIIDRKIQLTALSTSTDARAFSVKITQLRDNLAPDSCLQYFTEANGSFKTFNYDNASEVVQQRKAEYFNNLNYAICIKRVRGFCSITYTNEMNELENQFQLVNVDADEQSVVPPNQAGAEIFNCGDDYITINSVRLCGEKLNDGSIIEDFTRNALVTDNSLGPIQIPFRTDGRNVGRGFSLYYQQKPCEVKSV